MNQEDLLNEYYGDNARKLHHVVDKLLKKFGGISQKDYDDFYSIANMHFMDIVNTYNGDNSFRTWLYVCLDRKIKMEITRRNAEKRFGDRTAVSIDKPINGEDVYLADIIESDYCLEDDVIKNDEIKNPSIKTYLERLSKVNQNIILLLSDGYKANEIEQILHISHKDYADGIDAIYSYDNIQCLF